MSKLDDMVMREELAFEPLASGEVARCTAAIEEGLEDAGNTSNHPQTRLNLAYHAILGISLLALRVDGYRAKEGRGHHYNALNTLAETMGVPDDDIDYYQELRESRHHNIYDPKPVSASTAEEAISSAHDLKERLATWLEGRGALP
jgi:hypothetical protein